MPYKNTMDLHTHTDNSPDANHSATLLCECACEAGLRAIAITDHCECDAYYADRYDLSAKQSVFETAKAKSVFAGRLIVVSGIELGQPLHDKEAAEKALAKNLDFVLASQHHLLNKKEDFYLLDYSLPENEPKALLRQYFDELLEIVKWGNFDALAHLTYPLRYITGRAGIPVDLRDYFDQIDLIFREMAAAGKALEINMSGLRGELGDTMPPLILVKRFKEAGGEYITIGSDAHQAGDVGSGIQEGMALAEAAGFRYVTLYQRRLPVQIDLI